MKKILVSKECVACGSCIHMTDLLQEDEEGKAIPAGAGKVTEDAVAAFMKVMESCPTQAIALVEDSLVKATGKQGIAELNEYINEKLINFKVPEPNMSRYKFNYSYSIVPYNSPSGQNHYDYKSYSKAESAGLREFDRVMYSQKRALIQKVLVEYKHSNLNDIIFYQESEYNYYYQINTELSKLIDEIAAEVKEKTNNKAVIPKDFAKIELGPDHGFKDDFYLYRLRNLETIFTDSVVDELDSLSSYELYINTDDREDFNGRDMYCYNLLEVMDTFRRDIVEAIKDVINYSEELEVNIQRVVEEYEKHLKQILHDKGNYLIKELEKHI